MLLLNIQRVVAYDGLDLEVWSEFAHHQGMIEFGNCLDIHLCDPTSNAAVDFVAAIQRNLNTTDTILNPYVMRSKWRTKMVLQVPQ